ncbi:dioxygenase [Microbacterium sp. NPDC091382]|uniref:dioxygenase n=1 Tax=Microbacterium sp. NPDC091382 TaxID=3364210 RepID=UPI0038151817
MATGKDRTRATAQGRERARLYEARRRFHASVIQRRRRDNVIAGIAGGVLLLAVLGGQVAFYTLGPGAPEPAPSPSPSQSPDTTPAPSLAPSDSPTPTPTP